MSKIIKFISVAISRADHGKTCRVNEEKRTLFPPNRKYTLHSRRRQGDSNYSPIFGEQNKKRLVRMKRIARDNDAAVSMIQCKKWLTRRYITLRYATIYMQIISQKIQRTNGMRTGKKNTKQLIPCL